MKVRSYWDPVYFFRQIGGPYPRETPSRLHVRGSPNNQTLHSKVVFIQLIKKNFYTFDIHYTCNRPLKLLCNKR